MYDTYMSILNLLIASPISYSISPFYFFKDIGVCMFDTSSSIICPIIFQMKSETKAGFAFGPVAGRRTESWRPSREWRAPASLSLWRSTLNPGRFPSGCTWLHHLKLKVKSWWFFPMITMGFNTQLIARDLDKIYKIWGRPILGSFWAAKKC